MNELEEQIKQNKELLSKLGSQADSIKVSAKLDLISYDKEVADYLLPSVLNDNNDVYTTIGYEIINVGNERINNIKYVDSNFNISQRNLDPQEKMNIQSSFLTLLLSRPEYSFKVLQNQLKSDNNEDISLDELFNSYYFTDKVPQKKAGIYNIISQEHMLLPEYKVDFYPIYYVGSKDIVITSKTAPLVAQLINS